MVVIPNGYDLSRYAPDAQARERMRSLWGVAPGRRWSAAWPAGIRSRTTPTCWPRWGTGARGRDRGLQCALVGRGMSPGNAGLAALIDAEGLRGRVLLAGPSDDVPAVMNALDLHVLSSCAEGFPNVVAEAMACGTPCVATDVGDAAYIVGDTGGVAPAQQPAALAAAIEAALAGIAARGRDAAGAAGRQRVLAEFDLRRMVESYEAVWRRISGERA